MSWNYVDAAWKPVLQPLDKLLLLALADQADHRGTVTASMSTLGRLTGLSHSSVKRGLRTLVAEQLLELVQASSAAGATKRHRLHLSSVRTADTGRGLADLGSNRPQVPQGLTRGLIEPSLSPVLIPKSKNIKAGAAAPTIALLKKLVHAQFGERVYELNRPHEMIELTEDLKSRCRAEGLEMEQWDDLYQALREVLGAKGVPGYARPNRRLAQ